MNTVNLKINDASKTVAEHQINTSEGNPTIIKAPGNVNYELIDQETGLAPHHIVTKRRGDDLIIAFDKEGNNSDLIIEDFYDDDDSALIGQTEDGSYYYYVPDTAQVSDYVVNLVDGDSQGNALGGPPQANPWWIGVSDDGVGIWPWLLGLAGLGLIAAALGDDDDDDTTPVVSTSDAPDITAEDDGGITVVPGDDNEKVVIDYTDEEGNEETVTIIKDPTTDEWTPKDSLPDGVELDPTDGTVSIDPNEVEDETEVTATGTAPEKDPTSVTEESLPDQFIDITQIASDMQEGDDLGETDNYATINLSQSKNTVISGISNRLEDKTVTLTISDKSQSSITVVAETIIAEDGTWSTQPLDLSNLSDGPVTIKANAGSVYDIDLATLDTIINMPTLVDTLSNPNYPLSEKTGGVYLEAPVDQDLSSMTISYTDESRSITNEPTRHTFNVVKNGDNWILDENSTLQSGVTIKSNGEVDIVSDRLLDGSTLTVTFTDLAGNTATENTHVSPDDHLTSAGYRETNYIEDVFIATRGTNSTDLDEDVDSFIFKDYLSETQKDISMDGYFQIIKTEEGKAVINLTEKGFNSESNDFEVGNNSFNYSIDAIKDGSTLFEFNIALNLDANPLI